MKLIQKFKLFFPSSGFTLIEIVVTLAVLTILISTTFVGFNKYSLNQKLNSATDNLKNTINEAKADALSQVIRTSTCNSSLMTLKGYQVYLANSTTYNLKEICANSSGTLSYPDLKTIVLDSGLTVSNTPISINFLIQSSGGGIESQVDQQITISAGGSSRTVTVTPDGTIK